MKTVNEVSALTGVSARALHYYDSIGLLKPAQVTGSGYRLYDDAALERLQHILLFKELQFPLKEIRRILDSPDFDRNLALEQQLNLLLLQKEHLENLIDMARGIRMTGVRNLDFTAFDAKKIDEYAAQAKAAWGKTAAYKEFEEKTRDRSPEEYDEINHDFMELFRKFGELKAQNGSPDSPEVQGQVQKLRDFITEHFYNCTPEILEELGKMYAGGGVFTETIDGKGGKGTADFTSRAIDIYTGNQA
ncbi:MerR family transcriptional regulator [Clostridium transplantifaecale]|uniref:MerR family transcriptional regulator n=1 Tax=Clostridium transplantifaecale TaxID=2479838 RepID=UPI000F62E813|nr:MerR family transcriptional regulator [Clostridium transplantifaecale]